jgi:hypothetical protein
LCREGLSVDARLQGLVNSFRYIPSCYETALDGSIGLQLKMWCAKVVRGARPELVRSDEDVKRCERLQRWYLIQFS